MTVCVPNEWSQKGTHGRQRARSIDFEWAASGVDSQSRDREAVDGVEGMGAILERQTESACTNPFGAQTGHLATGAIHPGRKEKIFSTGIRHANTAQDCNSPLFWTSCPEPSRAKSRQSPNWALIWIFGPAENTCLSIKISNIRVNTEILPRECLPRCFACTQAGTFETRTTKRC